MPAGPDMAPLENPVSDRATKDWKEEEKKVVKAPLKKALFGDLHVHTRLSFDAYIGGVTAGPSEAYSFAKGNSIGVLGKQVRIVRPLDFAAVTDHSEYLGEMYSTQTKGIKGYNTIHSRMLRSLGQDTAKQTAFFRRMSGSGNRDRVRTHPNFFSGYKTTVMAWNVILDAAENHYQPGKFTTFAAYEWSKSDKGAHLHRNVIFKDMTVPNYPISAFEAKDEIALWNSLEAFRTEGSTVMAIPHNSNISNGRTFSNEQPDGTPIDKDYILMRHKNEPLVEIHQAKGSSEVHPKLWAEDEYANFELYNAVGSENINNYVRHVLKRGIKYKQDFGVNPYEYGIIASTDTHNGTPGNTEESDEYQGNHLFIDGAPEQRSTTKWILNEKLRTAGAINPGGLVGVWSRANTRTEIYESLEQKETFGTSGNRIQVRFFGGTNFGNDYEGYENMVTEGYQKGVPMGKYLSIEEGQTPQFLIWASKDPEGAALHKIQIIKGWLEDEELKEEIIDVVVTKNTFENKEDVVNLKTGVIDEQYGSSELFTKWEDPNFDESQEAFYYLRVLEVPTLRYTEWDKVRYNTPYPEDIAQTVIERAWTSPIWYSPNKN